MSTRSRLASNLALLLPLAALALAPAACGTTDEAPKRGPNGNESDGGGGSGGEGEDDGGHIDSGSEEPPAYTLDEVCDVLANEQCGAIEACCDSTGVGYDDAKCKAAVKATCEAQVAKVNESKLVFGPDSVDACTAATAALYSKCELSWGETFDMLLGIPACRDVFAGTKAAGEACATDEDCQPPSEASQVAVCEKAQCAIRPRFRAEKDPCMIGATVGCAVGLYCNADPKQQGALGQCEKVKAIGEDCDKSQQAAAKLECGWGNHCHPQQGKCIAGKPSGSACTDATFYECASYVCTDKKCAPLSVANAAICKGEVSPS